MECTLVMDRFDQSLFGKVHLTLQWKQTLTIIGTYWQSNILAGAGRRGVKFQQAGVERAAQDYEQATGDEVHVAVPQWKD